MNGLYYEQTALGRNFAPNNLCANFVKTDPTFGLLSRFSLTTLFSLLLSQRISFAYPLNLGLKWISFCPTVTQSIPIFSSTFVSINVMLYYICWFFPSMVFPYLFRRLFMLMLMIMLAIGNVQTWTVNVDVSCQRKLQSQYN